MKKLSIILISIAVFLTTSLFSQQLSEMRVVERSAKFLPEELIDKSVVDANGDVCAGLMIVTDLDGLTFSSYNGVVKVNTMPGKYTLFLQSNERVVEVYKTGFASLKIILSEQNIKLVGGQTWQITLTGEKKNDLIPITIKTKPDSATIWIDDKNLGSNLIQLVAPGRHELKVEKTGFQSATQTIDVSPKNVYFEVALKEIEMVGVQIQSSPAGAAIFIDNDERGATDKGFYLYPGKYRLKLSLSGYVDEEQDIEVKEGRDTLFSYSLTKNTGTLSLSITPSDADVFINKESANGKTAIALAPGRYRIDVRKTGYHDTTETVEIVRGRETVKRYALREITGKLQVTTSPLDAAIVVKKNGAQVYAWQGMKKVNDVPAGDYELSASASGYATAAKTFTVQENLSTIVDIQLVKGKNSSANDSGMVFVEGGTFQMGSPEGTGENDEHPRHTVTVSNFNIDKYEVTQEEYERVVGTNPSNFKCPTCPVENVSWNDAAAYAQKVGKRLPTEAEWEYAARGGKLGKGYIYSGSDNLDAVGWDDKNSGNKTHPVGGKQPNELGLYDMSGNVWEWCADWYDGNYYGKSANPNPSGPENGVFRVLRGGSWVNSDNSCRLAFRGRYVPDYWDNVIGFRCSRTQ